MKKICPKCKQEKDIGLFYKSTKHGSSHCCKSCFVSYGKTVAAKYSDYKKKAKSRKKVFELTLEQFSEFWKKDCVYCGDKIETIGLDRIDSNVGYVYGNVTSCCWDCNVMKRNKSKEEWFVKMNKILERKQK